ncbi:MAG: cation diffusion facilitator family transporter [Clostridiales Family XIII bacterium]|jgi:cation diffusion facilitator family transporter|nr:cation diffusion facilitator family transporter [Clostridiales Family XIII bacterium]
MTKFLIGRFIKDRDNTDSPEVRESYGKLAGVTGICTNVFLSLLKALLGIFSGSIAILADAVNNLSDAAASVITFVGFKMAAKKGDKAHPYGHARIEYMTGIVVAALIILVGFQLISSSYEKILNPNPVAFSYPTAILLAVAIGVKVWQMLFYFHLGKRIKSAALKAAGIDSRNDVVATSAVLLALAGGRLTDVNADGFMGLAVAAFIIYSGFGLIRETVQPLLGQAPDPDLIKKIKELVLRGDGVIGVHDLIVHDYGPGRIFASVHIEVDAARDILRSHDVIDSIEREAMKRWNIELVGHMDPVDTNDPLIHELKTRMADVVASADGVVDLHDLRVVRGEERINVIFDAVLSEAGLARTDEIREMLKRELKKTDERLEAVVTFDTDYSS